MLHIKRIKKYIGRTIIFGCISMILSSCKEEPSDSPYVEDEKYDTTVLIYAVATNSLSVNLAPDKEEMLEAVENIDLSRNKILIYQTTYRNSPQLLEIVHTEDGYSFEIVKEYTEELPALSPSRISEVINSVLDTYTSNNYGLIFWSHSSGSQPFLGALQSQNLPARSFGQDLSTKDPTATSINIDLLASLIPDGVFNFIWFDSCYMSNIESIYEFRGKCKYFVGYPTEVLDMGMPYDLVLPCITGVKPDPAKGAEEFFKYYSEYPYSSLRIATVAVIDMEEVEILSDVCREAYQYVGTVSPYSFLCYTRGSTGPFYELGDYVKAMTPEEYRDDFTTEWEKALETCVIYKAATERDFNGNYIDQERYSGISCHIFNPEDESLKESYYRSLSWYDSVGW
ncbi:MAG: hypothetical protein J1E95_07420 [Muribaculaceae bacterium]|nr:hypothetical protein [Muribaculaceae bacterium]